ncbi:MAG TPA: hypothetical protein VG146_03490 [Verrucomicrobiae bacterium]|nr:hypothetical protein [Verrucomicrobiae bacterium]
MNFIARAYTGFAMAQEEPRQDPRVAPGPLRRSICGIAAGTTPKHRTNSLLPRLWPKSGKI